MTWSCSNEELEITGLSGAEYEAPVTESFRANSGDRKESGAKPGEGKALLGVICLEPSDPMVSCRELNDNVVLIGASDNTRPKGRRESNDDSVDDGGNGNEAFANVEDAPVMTAGAVSGVSGPGLIRGDGSNVGGSGKGPVGGADAGLKKSRLRVLFICQDEHD